MAVGPSDEAIDTFTIFTSLPRANAIAWLQANGNEVDKATNAFFDGGSALLPPKASADQWNEREFHAEQPVDRQHVPSFSVHPPDTLNPNVFGAPSRPPSRVSNREGGAVPQQFAETEDEQINRAMAMSMSESQTLPGQETGVADTSTKTFGPAQREYYDTEKWSMTLPGAFAREILLNPEPTDRQRHPGTPAFLKPASDALHLASLVKILHAIPLARDALLNFELLRPDYGYDAQWWDGEPVKQLRVVNVDQGYHNACGQDLICEVQRLMAFLDNTERAYGSIEVVTKLQGRPQDGERITSFLEDWQRSTTQLAPDVQISNVFESRGLKRDPEEGEDKCQSFSCLPISVDSSMVDHGFSLYDTLDEVIWEGADGSDVFLKDVGRVVVFSISCSNNSGSGIGIDVPASWYPDRYLESSLPQAKEYRAQKTALDTRFNNLEASRELLLQFKTPRKPIVDASSLLATAKSHFEQTAIHRERVRQTTDTNGLIESESDVRYKDVLEQLSALDARITAKLKTFEQAKEDLRKLAQQNASLYTQPTDDPKTSPMHKYTLRGVATTWQICYVLERTKPFKEDDLVSLEVDDWQWWKLEYSSSDAKPVMTTRVSEQEVLRAARTESRNVLLIYADESAINHSPTPLPSQLVNFVRMDNLSFQNELETSLQSTRESPGKRKAMSDDSNEDDLVTEHPRSPPFNRDHLLDDSLYPNPPDYDDTPPSLTPTPLQSSSLRPLKPKASEVAGSSDDTIPISLRLSGQAVDPTSTSYTALDLDDTRGEVSREMQERRGGGGPGRVRSQADINEWYGLGDYVPEIKMEEEDDDDDETQE